MQFPVLGMLPGEQLRKNNQLGGKVVTLSGPDGFIYDKKGISGEKIDFMLRMRSSANDRVQDFADKFKVEFFPNRRPWTVTVDVAMPCATQNEIFEDDAKSLIKNGCKCICEAANMPTTLEAYKIFREAGMLFAPGKAANAGGVAVSGLEMAQDSMRLPWPKDEVDLRLHQIMTKIHETCLTTAERFQHSGQLCKWS